MTQEGQVTPPAVLWAQRKDILYVTICLEDCKNPEIKTETDKVYFKGVGGIDKKPHEVTINLYSEIDPEKTVQSSKGRNIELILTKKTPGPFWPRLTKESKLHWLKSDFNKWQDEDDSEDEAAGAGPDPLSLEKMMQQIGGLGGGADGGKPNLDDLDMGEEDGRDSDDDDLPDLE